MIGSAGLFTPNLTLNSYNDDRIAFAFKKRRIIMNNDGNDMINVNIPDGLMQG